MHFECNFTNFKNKLECKTNIISTEIILHIRVFVIFFEFFFLDFKLLMMFKIALKICKCIKYNRIAISLVDLKFKTLNESFTVDVSRSFLKCGK